jgi:L,D-transpeptidase YcbB
VVRASRREFLGGAAALAASFPAQALAQKKDERAVIVANTEQALDLVDADEPILSNDTASNLQSAVRNYEAFVATRGNWEMPGRDVFGLSMGNRGAGVASLRKRLTINGDIPPSDAGGDRFDETVDAALRLFQARHGLLINGHVDEATFYALSVPADYRLNQLRLNLQRIEAKAPGIDGRYVVVNIPAAAIETVSGGRVERRHTAVVGRIDRQTPILKSRIHQINFNPFWTVPKSIIRNDLIRYMNEDPEYLTKFAIRIFDASGQELQPSAIDWKTEDAVNYSFRQDPGPENSMGKVKINFHNPYAVYLHDTPTRGLFGENVRFLSSGCVRVEDVREFVGWVLSETQEWNLAAIDAVFASGERLDADVNNPVAIHTTYLTAWANRQGTVSFRDDVYQFDAEGRVDLSS